MTTKPTADWVMKAAEKIESCNDRQPGRPIWAKQIASIIASEHDKADEWIKCSERMPTEEDGNRWHQVEWATLDDVRWFGRWELPDGPRSSIPTHWRHVSPGPKEEG